MGFIMNWLQERSAQKTQREFNRGYMAATQRMSDGETPETLEAWQEDYHPTGDDAYDRGWFDAINDAKNRRKTQEEAARKYTMQTTAQTGEELKVWLITAWVNDDEVLGGVILAVTEGEAIGEFILNRRKAGVHIYNVQATDATKTIEAWVEWKDEQSKVLEVKKEADKWD